MKTTTSTNDRKAVNFAMPLWLLQEMKTKALTESITRSMLVQWTDLARETLIARFQKAQKGKRK